MVEKCVSFLYLFNCLESRYFLGLQKYKVFLTLQTFSEKNQKKADYFQIRSFYLCHNVFLGDVFQCLDDKIPEFSDAGDVQRFVR